MPQQLANRATTTLSSGITNSGTSLSVASATGFPASAPYRIVMYDTNGNIEFMEVTAGAGTTTWTVTRGVEDASRFPAFGFASGAVIAQVLTAGAFNSFFHATTGHDHSGVAGQGPKLGHEYITTPYVVAKATSQQTWATGFNTVGFHADDADPFNMYTPGNSHITLNKAGLWLLSGSVPSLTAGITGMLSLVLNAGGVWVGPHNNYYNNYNAPGLNCFGLYSAALNDTVYLWIDNSSNVSISSYNPTINPESAPRLAAVFLGPA